MYHPFIRVLEVPAVAFISGPEEGSARNSRMSFGHRPFGPDTFVPVLNMSAKVDGKTAR